MRPDGMSRLVSLIAVDAKAAVTLGTRRLRPTLGLKLLCWGVLVAMIVAAGRMNARFAP